ncbi:MAG: 50S ribosomal protein L33 [Chloroflexi bacterium]|nr:50S ribosomal protein L33 [Chloroflexota bacterium]
MTKKAARIPIVLAYTVCRARNYPTEKNVKLHPARLALNKYSPTCRTVTEHREVR